VWSHTSTTPKCTFVAWTEKPLPIYFQKFGCQECSIVHFEQLKRGKYFTQCVCVCMCVVCVCVCAVRTGEGWCPKGKTFNLQFKMHEIAALNKIILNFMAHTSQRCTTDCSCGDYVEWLNPRTHVVGLSCSLKLLP